MNHTETILEFDQIKATLQDYALSPQAKEILGALTPLTDESLCRQRLAETTQARTVLDGAGSPPLAPMEKLEELLTLCQKGSMLLPEQLEAVASFLAACRRMKGYLDSASCLGVALTGYGQSIDPLTDLGEAIAQTVENGRVLDSASPALRDVRRKLENAQLQVKTKLEGMLRARRECFAEGYLTQRNGRFVLPVKKEFKNQVAGSVVDISGTGGTYFIEPTAATRLLDEIALLRVEEDGQVRKILYTLTALVDDLSPALRMNIEVMSTLDVIFAKGKLSRSMAGIAVPVTVGGTILLTGARHPLLPSDACVPLDFAMGPGVRGVVITGPNTGGKTVALKTVGLLTMMAQCGLHIPAQAGQLALCDHILCDIGDGQSISQNLSTFSSHIKSVISILEQATPDSLVLLDELGSGTDPAEGMGIAVAILEELRQKGCLLLATTHYPEVKDYAAAAGSMVNARMAFDRESLKPLYRLEIGEAGESCALYIAQRLGFPPHMLALAREACTGPIQPRDVTPTHHVSTLRRTPVPTVHATLPQFNLGDSVAISPDGTLGLVFQSTDGKGMVGVQIQGAKQLVSYKRITLKTPASELYPPDYDFSILFDTVANRKARRQMDKKFVPGLTITYDQPL